MLVMHFGRPVPEMHSHDATGYWCRDASPASPVDARLSRAPRLRLRLSMSRREYELYLAVENIDHTRTTTKTPQINGICGRFHKTVLNEFYRVQFRKKIYTIIEQLQNDRDAWLIGYNEERPHQGRWCYAKTPRQTFLDSLPLAKEQLLAA